MYRRMTCNVAISSKSSSLFLMVLLVIFCLKMSVITATWNKTDYCGIPPWPEAVPDIPLLSSSFNAFGMKLIDTYVFFRHGDRSSINANCFHMTEHANYNYSQCPGETVSWHSGLDSRSNRPTQYDIPFAPIQDKQVNVGNCHLGQLTQKGVMQSYQNGRRFAKFVELAYAQNRGTNPWRITEENFQARTTDSHRTRESLVSFLSGAFDELKWVKKNPKNMNTVGWVDAEVDALALGKNMCPETDYLRIVYRNAGYLNMWRNVVQPLNAQLVNILNDPLANVNDVFDCIKIFQCHNIPLPTGLDAIADEIQHSLEFFWKLAFVEQDHITASQIFSGPMLIELSQLFTQSALKTSYSGDKPKIHLFSGHDLGSVMNLFAVFIGNNHNNGNFHWTPYSSTLQFDIYQSDVAINGKKSFMRFLWLGDVVTPHFCIGSMINNELCPTDIVLQFITTRLPTKEICPKYPLYDWAVLRDNVLVNDARFTTLTTQQPTLATSITTLYNTLYNNLAVNVANNNISNTAFRTLTTTTTSKTTGQEQKDITFEEMVKMFDQFL